MEKYLTPDNIQYVLIFGTWFVYAIKKMVQRTDTKRDDQILSEIEKAYSWVSSFAPKAFFLIEKLAKAGRFSKLEKAMEYIRLIRTEYEKQHNKPLPKQIETIANIYAQGQAAIDKATLLKDHIEAKITGKISPNDEAI